jgi:hydrogenase maturation protease
VKTIVVGLGNPILGDDGVGWRVVEEMQSQMPASPAIDFECLSLGGVGLMEHLIGYDHAILIDSFIVDEEDVGSILIHPLEDLPNYSAFHITSVHDTSLQNALELGRVMGAHLPQEVTVVGIAIRRIHEFGEELSPPVSEAVPEAAHIALNLLKQAPMINKEESHP